jgi:D-alanine transaminase
LRGITRTGLMDVTAKLGIKVQEREFSRDEMLSAREVFITAATSICFPIIEIDGHPIGNRHPGEVAERIRSSFFDVAEKTVI